MDFRDLLELAQGNSSIAKKKSEKLSKEDDGRDGNVKSSAVAAYLAKKKKEKEAQAAAEAEERRKRIAARVNANIGKKENKNNAEKKPIQTNGKHNNVKTKDIKFHVHESHKKKKDKRDELSEQSKERKNPANIKPEKLKGKQPTDLQKKQKHKESRHEHDHRKEKQRTDLSDKKVKQKQKKPTNGSGLSFMDLMKLAKCNSENPGSGKIVEKAIKRPPPKPSEPAFDPDMNVKVKRKPPATPPVSSDGGRKTSNKQQDRRDLNSHSKDKVKKHGEQRQAEQKPMKHQREQQNNKKLPTQTQQNKMKNQPQQQKIRPVNKFGDSKQSKPNKPVQRGLVVETVSSSRVGGGIAAQNRGIPKQPMRGEKKPMKRSAHDYEDEFEKEERMLAKKRKLFEMKRITGNKNLTEDDLLDDYDLDEEDEEDEDFIDDTEDGGNVSKYIRSIFGYDRFRYEDSDDDLADMESSYAQIEKEEARSARIAKIEDDYERMKEEEAEERMKQRKMAKSKTK